MVQTILQVSSPTRQSTRTLRNKSAQRRLLHVRRRKQHLSPLAAVMKPRITVITLTVSDLEQSVAFYRDGLGFSTEGIVPWTPTLPKILPFRGHPLFRRFCSRRRERQQSGNDCLNSPVILSRWARIFLNSSDSRHAKHGLVAVRRCWIGSAGFSPD